MARNRNVVNVDNVTWIQAAYEESFQHSVKHLSTTVGADKLGCSLYTVPPGKSAFPAHAHHANEEAIFILEGQGKMRIGNEEFSVSKGDYVGLPAGGDMAHKLVNTSDGDITYLCMSTLILPEVVEYPDSGKIGALAGTRWHTMLSEFYTGEDVSDRYVRKFFHSESDVDYWKGE